MSRDPSGFEEIVIDPRDFISGPYAKCPKCKRQNSFGLLWVSRDSYSKRCRDCRHLQSYTLPKLKKTVVYIDQFAISGIAKALSSNLGGRDTTDQFWRRLFEKLDELVKLQLVICPTSHFHEQESLFYERESLKRMYDHLSGGVTFYDSVTIRRFQVMEYFRQLQAGRPSPELPLERRYVVSGDLNEWQEKFNLTVSFEPRQQEIDDLADARHKTTTALRELVDYWKSRKGKKWQDFFKAEALAFGQLLWERHFANLAKLHTSEPSMLNPDQLLNLTLGEEQLLISGLLREFPDSDDPNVYLENLKVIGRFLHSDHMERIPSNQIRASLWASLADQFVNQRRKRAIESGMVTDIEMLSTLLPYCDIVLVDREMWGLYNRKEVRGVIEGKYGSHVFSLANKTELLNELGRIKDAASKRHLATVKKVYGKDWPQPFVSIYES